MTHAMTEYKEALQGKSLASRWNHNRTDKQLRYAAQRSFALQLVQASEGLRKCTPQSIQNCFLDIAYIGLTLAPSQSLVYLIPYGDKATVTIALLTAIAVVRLWCW